MKTVDVWRASLDRSAEELAALKDFLSATERNRASRFRKDVDSSRYIAGRATLRILIGSYISVRPELIRLYDLPGGKPALAEDHDSSRIHFNISHSGKFALLAFSDHGVGIDVERIESNSDMPRVAANFFTLRESATFRGLEASEQQHFFFRTWVRKEAYLKATGNGLSTDPAQLSIGVLDGSNAMLTNRHGQTRTDHAFKVFDIANIGDHVAAIAVAASICLPTIQVRDFTPIDSDLPNLARQKRAQAPTSSTTDRVGFEPTVRY